MDWLDQLDQIREDAEKQRKDKVDALDLSILGRKSKATKLLSQVDALKSLRKVRSVLLKNKATIDTFDQSKQYDQVMALIWQGSIANPSTPNPDDNSEYFYILVGVKRGRVYVNGKQISANTPEALKAALVTAAKNTGIQRQGELDKKN